MDGGCQIKSYRPKRYLLCSALLLWLLAIATSPNLLAEDADPNHISNLLDKQRIQYQRATKALAEGNRSAFRAIRNDLREYPLIPYLDYAELSSRIQRVSPGEIDEFFKKYSDIPLTAWLRERWLKNLAAKKHWREFIRYYDSDLKSVELACYDAYAQYSEGDRELGISRARALWQEGKSQPKACDPVFKKLIDDGHIDNDLSWKRFVAAVVNHQYGLAKYITRFFTLENSRRKGELYLEVDRNPRKIADYRSFSENTNDETQIIYHGLTHLARIDARLALKLWNRYHQSHTFSPDDESGIIGTLVRSLYLQGYEETADKYFFLERGKLTSDILEWRLREMINAADWQTIIDWSQQLDETLGADSHWKYWHARALELSGNQSPETAKKLFLEISSERSFYGFLASEWLHKPYHMQHQPVDVKESEISSLASTPAFLRIRELYFHKELTWARREWYGYLNKQPPSEWIVAAKLAESWGWYNLAIMSMIQAQYWNDIVVRFPVPYADDFLNQARATSIPVNLLLALSRQESAFNEKVTSPAGAKGLMQLMPATARETARKFNIHYSGAGDLENADKNILIGSRYYKLMLERFDNNRILATAAYNAGPHRVAAWRKRSDGKLPFDAWIEVIPFRETRNYVQNVLAFSIIYAHQLGMDVGILSAEEKNTLL